MIRLGSVCRRDEHVELFLSQRYCERQASCPTLERNVLALNASHRPRKARPHRRVMTTYTLVMH